MKRTITWTLATSLFIVCSSRADDKPAPSAKDELLGDWVNTEKDAIIRYLTISTKADNWTLEVWCKSDDRDKPGKKAKLTLFAAEEGAKSGPSAHATVQYDLATDYLKLRVEKGELVVEAFTIYKLQPELNCRTVGRFKRIK